MRLRIKNTRLTLIVIAWLQIIGGITGIGLMAYLMLQTDTINGAILLIFLIGLALFIYSIYAGKRLLTDDDKRSAIILSVVNQALQIVHWSMLGYGLSYSSGAEMILGMEGLTFKFNFAAVLSTFRMSINSDNAFSFKINLIPVLVTFILVDIFTELKESRKKIPEAQEVKADELR